MHQKPTLDEETQKSLTDAQEVELLIGSKGWGVIKGKLDALILDLQNINNLEVGATASLETQLLGRKMASDLLFAWLKNDVYGFVEQQKALDAKGLRAEDESYLDRGV